MILSRLNRFLHPIRVEIPQEIAKDIEEAEKFERNFELTERESSGICFSMAEPSFKKERTKKKKPKKDINILPPKMMVLMGVSEDSDEGDYDYEEEIKKEHEIKKQEASYYPKIDDEQLEKSFQELLFEHIDKTGLKDSAIYKKAFVDRRVFSKIRSNKNYHPSKGTIIQLALALELDIDDALKLLQSSDYYLSKNTKLNVLIHYLFENKVFDIIKANDLLYTICDTTLDKL